MDRASQPRWGADGRELFFMVTAPGKDSVLASVPVSSRGDSFLARWRRPLKWSQVILPVAFALNHNSSRSSSGRSK